MYNKESFLLFLQDQEYRVTQAILRVPSLKESDPLPRFLLDDQICLLRDDLESRVSQAQSSSHLRDARLDRAAFYLLWQGGLRLGEVTNLRIRDVHSKEGYLYICPFHCRNIFDKKPVFTWKRVFWKCARSLFEKERVC